MPDRGHTVRLILALGALYVIWGSTYYAIHEVVKVYPPLVFAGMRFLLAGGVLMAILAARGWALPTRKQWASSALIGFLLLGVGNGAVTIASQWASSSVAAIAVATMPMFAALYSTAWGERPTGREWLGIAVGIAGVVVLYSRSELSLRDPAGLLLFLAPVSWALGSVWSRRLDLPQGLMATAAQMLAAGVMMSVAGFARGETMRAPATVEATLWGLYLVTFGSLIAFSAYGWLLRNTRPALFASYAYVNPVIAVAIGVGLGGEIVRPETIAAAVFVCVGVALVSLGGARRAQAPRAPQAPAGDAAVQVPTRVGALTAEDSASR